MVRTSSREKNRQQQIATHNSARSFVLFPSHLPSSRFKPKHDQNIRMDRGSLGSYSAGVCGSGYMWLHRLVPEDIRLQGKPAIHEDPLRSTTALWGPSLLSATLIARNASMTADQADIPKMLKVRIVSFLAAERWNVLTWPQDWRTHWCGWRAAVWVYLFRVTVESCMVYVSKRQ